MHINLLVFFIAAPFPISMEDDWILNLLLSVLLSGIWRCSQSTMNAVATLCNIYGIVGLFFLFQNERVAHETKRKECEVRTHIPSHFIFTMNDSACFSFGVCVFLSHSIVFGNVFRAHSLHVAESLEYNAMKLFVFFFFSIQQSWRL